MNQEKPKDYPAEFRESSVKVAIESDKSVAQTARNDRLRLYYKDFAQISLFPIFLNNKKIADCLPSIDTLIATQTQRLDTLKAHKKGLMQQLFHSLAKE